MFHFVCFYLGGFLTFSHQCCKIENCLDKDGLIKGKQREQIIRHVLYFWWWGGPVAPSRKFTEVVVELSRTFLCAFWWDSQICQCGCQLYPDFGLYCGLCATWMQRCRSFICLSPVTPVPPPWHNAEDNARVPPHQTAMRNGEKGEKEGVRGTDAEHRNTMRAETWLGIKAKLNWWKKNFLLNWLYTQEKKNRNLTLSSPSSLRPLSRGANCLHSTSVYVYMLLSKPVFAGADPKVQFIWRADNTPKSFINPHIMYSIGTIGFQRANFLESGPNLFSLWSFDSLFHICGYHPCRFGGAVVVVFGRGGGCLSTYFPH